MNQRIDEYFNKYHADSYILRGKIGRGWFLTGVIIGNLAKEQIKSIQRCSHKYETPIFKKIDFKNPTPYSLGSILSSMPQWIECYINSNCERDKFDEVMSAIGEYLNVDFNSTSQLDVNSSMSFSTGWHNAGFEWNRIFDTKEKA